MKRVKLVEVPRDWYMDEDLKAIYHERLRTLKHEMRQLFKKKYKMEKVPRPVDQKRLQKNKFGDARRRWPRG